MVSLGDNVKCPECSTTGRVVWISQDKKRMGVHCHASHGEAIRVLSKFGAHNPPSTRTRKDVVFLTEV